MRIALVGPVSFGCEHNPGWHMIADGIRYLARQAVPNAQFMPIDLEQDNPAHWSAAATCEALIICGNPRFSLSPEQWWECGIWQRLVQIELAGVRVIDGWAGAALPMLPEMNIEQMAAELMAFSRTAQYLALAKIVRGRITRDAVMQRVYELAGAPSAMLPCSSWWAASWHHVGPVERDVDAILLLALPGHDWLPGALRTQRERMARERPCRFVATTWGDYLWARGAGLDEVALIPDAESLLRFYAHCKRVLAFRIHAAIPAASVGCEVSVIEIDSRALTCDPFGLPRMQITELLAREPVYAPGVEPDENAAVKILKGMLLQ